MNKSTSTILDIQAMQIYDSRGLPTVECEVQTPLGRFRASVPSGASTGKYEAHEMRDNDPKINLGKSVHRAVENINTVIRSALLGRDCLEQASIDKYMAEELDGSKNEYGWNKAKLGANAILAVSMAVCRAGAAATGQPLYAYLRSQLHPKYQAKEYSLPCPAFNVINGGKHGGNELAFQEFMILPLGAGSFSEAMQMGSEVYHTLKKLIQQKYGIGAINVGDEGGFSPPLVDHHQALQLVSSAIKSAGYEGRISIAMDCAASQFFDEHQQKYNLRFKSKEPQLVSSAQLTEVYSQIADKYPLVSIEDGFDQDDWQSWSGLTAARGSKLQVVGDDLLVTNLTRIREAVERKACNALLLKLNQIGTVSEALAAAQLAMDNGWGVMVSHRSGQTEDTFIAHVVTALGCGQIKTGAPCRSERLSKYNELLRIERQLGKKAKLRGPATLQGAK